MKILLQIAALALVLTANAQGTSEAVLNFSGSIVGNSPHTVGWTFQTTGNISVTDLGVFNYIVTSQTNIQVGLWDSSNNLLASNTITPASTLTNQTRYASITPVLCIPGVVYHIGAFAPNVLSIQFDVVTPDLGGSVTLSPELQLRGSAESVGASFSSPAEIAADGSIFLAPNFQYTPVAPEPSGFALLCLGGLVFTAVNRKSAFGKPR